jgi:uncharacterized membrane protein
MNTVIAILIPALLLVYYLMLHWTSFKNSRILQGLVGSGLVIYYVGMFLNQTNPNMGSLLKLTGATILFTIVVFHTMTRPKEKTPDQVSDQDEGQA